MKRIKLVLAVAAVMVAMLAAVSGPAMAQTISVGNVCTGFSTLNNIGTGFETLNSTLNGTLVGLNGFNTLNGIGSGFVGGGGLVVL